MTIVAISNNQRGINPLEFQIINELRIEEIKETNTKNPPIPSR